MRIVYLQILFTFLCFDVVVAQQEDTLKAKIPNFKLLRAEEDYSALRKEESHNTIWRKLKYIPLGEQSYLSVGGNIRSEVQYRGNEDWIDQENVALFQRFMLHSDFRFGNKFRLFNQFKSGYTVNRAQTFFLDNDEIDFHQLFFEYGNKQLDVRLGRQEIILGARRLVSVREGTNIRQSFDGIRLTWKPDTWKVEIVGLAYNPQRVGAFDNEINTDELLWGVYATKYVSTQQIEFYYLGYRDIDANFVNISGEEVRHSLGCRWEGRWEGRWGQFKLNNEALIQVGSIEVQSIFAWTISADINYLFEEGLVSGVGLKCDVISGDDSSYDYLGSFNAMYPRGGYFGLLALIGPSNLVDIHPSVNFALSERFSVGVDVDFFWRYSLDDGIYFPSGRLNRVPGDSTNRFIGYQTGLQLGFQANRFITIESSFFYFFNGSFIKYIAEDNDISLGTFTGSFTF